MDQKLFKNPPERAKNIATGRNIANGTGHRKRLRKKLFTNGGEGMHDHELLEYLLALAIPRRDTKPLAKQLLQHFGSLTELIAADSDTIARQPGMGEASTAAIKIVQAVTVRLLAEPVQQQPILSSWQALLDYLRADMAYRTTERVRILYLNAKNILVRDELASEGSVDTASIYTREVIRRALDLGATSMIIVHNHPSGDPSPSRADIAMTHDIQQAGNRLGIIVHDHIIVSKNGFTSMRNAGLI